MSETANAPVIKLAAPFANDIAALLYLVSAILFILALRGLSSPETAREGNRFGMIGMGIAVFTTLFFQGDLGFGSFFLIVLAMGIGGGIGAVIAQRIPMTAMPQLVAAFHSLVGLAAVFVAAAAMYTPEALDIAKSLSSEELREAIDEGVTSGSLKVAGRFELALGVAIGAITFSGSIIAFAKLQGIMSGAPILLPNRHQINIGIGIAILLLILLLITTESKTVFWLLTILALIIGFLIIIPIGGADMPVVVSMLNSYSGWAAAGIGFTLENTALIIVGALVGSSGAILSYIMCKGMNRSFISVILGGFGGDDAAAGSGEVETRPVKQGSAEDAAFVMKNAGSVIIVPGYGMAVAQAQHALREMADGLKEAGVKLSYAIHPVAGRMPGHMNVLLAEANVPYDEVYELEDINSEFAQTDVVFVIGANDVTNPAAKTDPQSAIYGMPILEVDKAGTVLFVKRGLGTGYAGVQNELFFRDNTMMLFGDAKKMVEEVVKAMQ
ncbi:MAG: NAD(P)(+) transhydrogenase (Re/Si-specific) subunit beta [Pseudomonadota bacterium]